MSSISHFISEILAVSTHVHDLVFTPFLLHQFLSSLSSVVFRPPVLIEDLPPMLTPPTVSLVHSYFFMPTLLLKVLHKIQKALHKITPNTHF